MSNRANCFIKLDHDIVDTAAWLYIAKSGSSKLLIDIWRRHNGKNNGSITYSIRDAQRRFGCSSKTAVMWFRELQELGFIVAEQRGSFSRKTGALDARHKMATHHGAVRRQRPHPGVPEMGCGMRLFVVHEIKTRLSSGKRSGSPMESDHPNLAFLWKAIATFLWKAVSRYIYSRRKIVGRPATGSLRCIGASAESSPASTTLRQSHAPSWTRTRNAPLYAMIA
jgi:hypothetical protein